ncbi:hypothetical protein KPZU09_24840 [Klebsiella pneumoniae]|uniref:Uncharacterized protein n=1 Tax=Klebsiella pneumoniae TaxID=573 RepID=A0A919HSP1_KLEPN|nr:hypothetical protein KPZU09_24840 [Klebsiella pneumoniae]
MVSPPLVSGPVCCATSSVTCRSLTGATVVSTVSTKSGEWPLVFPATSVTVVLEAVLPRPADPE